MDSRTKDLILAKQVELIISGIRGIEGSCIRVTVDDGWVQLDGKVSSESDRKLIESRVDQVFGVSRIVNNLTFSCFLQRK